MENRPIGMVIFDNDGVLVDTEHHANHVLAGLLTDHGIPTTYRQSLQEYLGTSLTFVREACATNGHPTLPADFEDQYHHRLFDRLENGVEPIPGALDTLTALTIPFCVASSGTHRRIEFTLRGADLWKLCDGRIFSADDVVRGKPEPDLFLHAAASSDVPPERCMVVEDSPWGIEAANRAGMMSLGFAYRTPAARLEAATAGVISRLAELHSFLQPVRAS